MSTHDFFLPPRLDTRAEIAVRNLTHNQVDAHTARERKQKEFFDDSIGKTGRDYLAGPRRDSAFAAER